MTHNKNSRIPTGQTVTNACAVVDFCPQKVDPHCIWITAGGNSIKYPGKLLTRTANLTTFKLMWNSVLSTKDAKYMCLDIKNFYLSAPLNQYKYMKMTLALFLEWIIMQYNLDKLALNGFVYLEMHHTVWGLPQAGILANKLLWKSLLPHGYFKCPNTPGLWKHSMCPILFTLVMENFGVKYVSKGKEHINH